MEDLLLVTILFSIISVSTLGITSILLYRYSKEAQRKDFFKINIKGWNIRNLIVNLMISPIYWFIQVGIIAGFSLLLLAFMLSSPYYSESEAFMTFFAAGAISLAATILYSLIIWLLDYKDREPLKIFPTLFLWGCMSAIIAFFINTIIDVLAFITLPEELVYLLTPTIVAPVVEEFFKGAGLFVISRQKNFHGIMDGIVYGFIIGMGFAFIEDWAYYTQYGPVEMGIVGWLEFIFLRSIITGAAHGILTATTGIFLGFANAKKSKNTLIWLAGGLIVAMFLHSAFNTLSIVDAIIFALTGIEFSLLFVFMLALLIGLGLMIKKGLHDFDIHWPKNKTNK